MTKKYVYFLSYIYTTKKTNGTGSCEAALPNLITDIANIHQAQTALLDLNPNYKAIMITNFILLRTEKNP